MTTASTIETTGPRERPGPGARLEVLDTVDQLRLAFAVARDHGGHAVVIASDAQRGLTVMRPAEAGSGGRADGGGRDDPAVVIVAPSQDPSFLLGALTAGADAVVLGSSPPEVLERAISTVTDGGFFIDPAIADVSSEILAGLVRGWALFDLSPRQLQVLWWLPTGRSCAEIAEAIGVSEGTVKSYLHRIQTKLGADDRMELLAIARREGLL